MLYSRVRASYLSSFSLCQVAVTEFAHRSAGVSVCWKTYMKAMPTMPKPTTTTLFAFGIWAIDSSSRHGQSRLQR